MKKFIIAIQTCSIFFSLCAYVYAADSSKGLGCGGSLGPFGELLCDKNDKELVGNTLNKGLGNIIGFMTIIAALWFMFQFIIGGYQWIASGGDKNNLEQARDKIINSIIGLIIVVVAWIIVGLIGKLLGLDILNPGSVLQTIGL